MNNLPKGLRAKYEHYRHFGGNVYKRIDRAGLAPESRGGYTICRLLDSEDNVVHKAYAVCHPNENYCKRIGREVSLGRALKGLRDYDYDWKKQPELPELLTKFPAYRVK